MIDNLQKYFKEQQVALQWSPILRAMAAEMSAHIEENELHALFFKIGQRFASDMGDNFQGVQTLEELAEDLNDFWARLNWGWVGFQEANGCIDITHEYAPLAQAFGEEALPWSVGLLEGFYQTLFNGLGANDAMAVRHVGEQSEEMAIRLRFGRPGH